LLEIKELVFLMHTPFEMKTKLILLFLFTLNVSFAQNERLESILSEIDYQQDTIKAVFDWVTDNIRYDVYKLNQLKQYGGKKKDSRKKAVKKKTQQERDADRIEKAIKNKKGVCQDYSLLIDALVKKLGYESYIIEGCTKNKQGKINAGLGHAWNAIKVNGTWKLFDSTWGAGYVKNEKKFIKKYNARWYDVDPKEMLKDHMPYDPVWQLSTEPISYDGFKNNSNTLAEFDGFDFNQILNDFTKLNQTERLRAQLDRSEKCGNGNSLVRKWRKSRNRKLEFQDLTNEGGGLQLAQQNYKEAVDLLNQCLKAKNKKFKGSKYSSEIAEQNIILAHEKTTSAITQMQNVSTKEKSLKTSLRKNIQSSKKMLKKINSELNFISTYNSN